MNSATMQITDVLQQAETSLQKASGGFSFFGGRQEKCTVGFVILEVQIAASTNARDR